MGLEAMTLLYRLASTPATAADARSLLHELQVHQVELDLQLCQMEANERELSEELASYKALFEFAPAGYFLIGIQGDIIEVNRAGAELFGTQADSMRGRTIDALVRTESRPAMLGLLAEMRASSARATCRVTLDDGDNEARESMVVASPVADSETFLLLFVDAMDSGNPAVSSA
jgi:PAS domain S-box-containing protein